MESYKNLGIIFQEKCANNFFNKNLKSHGERLFQWSGRDANQLIFLFGLITCILFFNLKNGIQVRRFFFILINTVYSIKPLFSRGKYIQNYDNFNKVKSSCDLNLGCTNNFNIMYLCLL